MPGRYEPRLQDGAVIKGSRKERLQFVETPAAIDLILLDIWLRWRLQADRSLISS
jgi:hypothetical protein